MNPFATILEAIVKPIAGAYSSRQSRKQAVSTARIKLQAAAADGDLKVNFNDQEWEALAKLAEANSWKDEYVTVSVVSILNIIILGGIAQAFGYVEVLGGIAIAIGTLVSAGVDVGFLMETVILSAVGLHWMRRF